MAALPTGSTQFSAANNQAAGTGLVSSLLVSTVTLAYDASGDLLGPTGTASPNIYDAEGRLCATPANSGGYEGYLYDAGGNRVAKGTLTSASCDFSINSQTGKPNNGFVLSFYRQDVGCTRLEKDKWRTERDSNPRYPRRYV